MADYFPVLSRAVAGLENNTGEARRAVYERARGAIVRQLRAIDPPLSEEDIARERMQLEEAIRKVEASAAGASPAQAAQPAAPPPASEPRPGPAAGKSSAPQAAPAKPAPAKPAPAKPAPVAANEPTAPSGTAGQSPRPAAAPSRPAKRADGRPIVRVAGETARSDRGGRSRVVAGALALAAIIVIGGLFAGRSQIAALFGGGSQPATEAAAPKSEPENKTAEAQQKADDRLPQEDAAAPAEPERQAAQEPPPAQQPEAAAPAAPAAQESAPAAAPSEAAPAGPLVAQRATLYEEGPNQQSGEAVPGTVVWRTESVSGGQNQPLETAIRGDVDIPGRKVRATIIIRRNMDATLPASHTIELQFKLPDDFPNAGITNVPGVLMKADESARGAAVSGLSVRVTNGFFLIGLSNLETERSVNEQLLRDRGWLDIPILYDNGRRAVLTLEKGTPGTQAFNDAFAAWSSAAAASAKPADR